MTLQNIETLMSYTWVNLLSIPEEYKKKSVLYVLAVGKSGATSVKVRGG